MPVDVCETARPSSGVSVRPDSGVVDYVVSLTSRPCDDGSVSSFGFGLGPFGEGPFGGTP